MTNDKQLEIWRAEFCEHYRTKRCTSFHDGRFLDDRTEILYHGWLAAKRSMQPIELPDSDDYFDKFETNIYGYESAVEDAITAAGYSYRVNE